MRLILLLLLLLLRLMEEIELLRAERRQEPVHRRGHRWVERHGLLISQLMARNRKWISHEIRNATKRYRCPPCRSHTSIAFDPHASRKQYEYLGGVDSSLSSVSLPFLHVASLYSYVCPHRSQRALGFP